MERNCSFSRFLNISVVKKCESVFVVFFFLRMCFFLRVCFFFEKLCESKAGVAREGIYFFIIFLVLFFLLISSRIDILTIKK